MKHYVRILPLLLLLTLLSCDEQGAPTSSDPPSDIPATIVEPSAFPNAIGTIWVYRVTYPWTGLEDLIQVRITDTVRTAEGYLASVWEFVAPGRSLHPLYVATVGDTVFFYTGMQSFDDPRKIILAYDHMLLLDRPPGSRWAFYPSDTTTVTGTTSLDVPAGHYDDVATLIRVLTGGPVSSLWFKPHVGFVRMIDPLYQSRVPGEEWRLVRFLP